MSDDNMGYEIYTKSKVNFKIINHSIARFATFTDLSICLSQFINAYGDNLYVRPLNETAERIFGRVAKEARFVNLATSTNGY